MGFQGTFTKWRVTPKTIANDGVRDTGFRVGAFLRDMGRFLEKIGNEELQKRIDAFELWCTEVFHLIIARTPVDTGLAQSSWQISFEREGTKFKCAITNPVHYVIFLEYGWSKQAPYGMVRITLQERGLPSGERGLWERFGSTW